jgi:CHASE2 domain-containing sensor protein
MRKKLLFESFLATILVFVVLLVLFFSINISFKPFNYIVKSIKHINLNDMYFSQIANNEVDTNMVIIDVGTMNRGEIAMLIDKVASEKPAAIGIDVLFSTQLQTEYDSLLQAVLFANSQKIVLARDVSVDPEDDYPYWLPQGFTYGHIGLLSNEHNTETVREFMPLVHHGVEDLSAFSVAIIEKYNPEIAEDFHKRHHKTERINYIGNLDAFRHFSGIDFLSRSDDGALQNKIVLLGYCGLNQNGTTDVTDKFYTPLGFNMDPHRLPDTYGIVLHANIISMMLNEKYINNAPYWLIYLLTIVLTFLHVWFFSYFYVRKHLYYHVAAKLIQLVSFTLMLWIVFLVFSRFNIYVPTKYFLMTIILSVDVLYLYEALAVFLHKRLKWHSIFIH